MHISLLQKAVLFYQLSHPQCFFQKKSPQTKKQEGIIWNMSLVKDIAELNIPFEYLFYELQNKFKIKQK